MSQEHQSRRYEEAEAYEPQFGGSVLKEGVRPRDSIKKHMRTIFFSQGYVGYNCLVDAVISCFRTLFTSPGGYIQVRRQSLRSLTEFYVLQRVATAGSQRDRKFSLESQ